MCACSGNEAEKKVPLHVHYFCSMGLYLCDISDHIQFFIALTLA